MSVPLLVLFPILIQLGFVFIGGQAGRLLDIAGIKASFPRIMAGFPVGAVARRPARRAAGVRGSVGRRTLLLATALAQAAFAGLVLGDRPAVRLGELRLRATAGRPIERQRVADDARGRPLDPAAACGAGSSR